MKKFIHRLRILYCRYLFQKWFIHYLKKGMIPAHAAGYAETILFYLVPQFIDYEDYLDMILQEVLDHPNCREKLDGDTRLKQEPWYMGKD